MSLSPVAQYIYPLIIFSNAEFSAALRRVYNILHDETWHKKVGKNAHRNTRLRILREKVIVLITGYKVDMTKLKEKWRVFPMEVLKIDANENGLKRKLIVVPEDEGQNEIVERLGRAIEVRKIDSYVYTTPDLLMYISLL